MKPFESESPTGRMLIEHFPPRKRPLCKLSEADRAYFARVSKNKAAASQKAKRAEIAAEQAETAKRSRVNELRVWGYTEQEIAEALNFS